MPVGLQTEKKRRVNMNTAIKVLAIVVLSAAIPLLLVMNVEMWINFWAGYDYAQAMCAENPSLCRGG